VSSARLSGPQRGVACGAGVPQRGYALAPGACATAASYRWAVVLGSAPLSHLEKGLKKLSALFTARAPPNLHAPLASHPPDATPRFFGYAQDKNPGCLEEATRVFRLVSEAYETLSDPDARYAYDLDLAQAKHRPGDAPRFDGGAARSGWTPGSGRGSLFPDTAWQHPRRGGGVHHRDPFELFRAFFGGADPFEGSFFGDDLGMSGRGYAATSPFASIDPWAGHHAMLANAMMMTSAGHGGSLFDDLADSARRQLPPGATSISSQTQTSIINGVRVTRTTRTVRHADGRVETETKESTENIGGGGSGRIPVTQRSSGQQALRLGDARQQSSGGGGAVTDVLGRAEAGQRGGGSFFGRSWF
jgi:curved DNA-binding protein CbpA